MQKNIEFYNNDSRKIFWLRITHHLAQMTERNLVRSMEVDLALMTEQMMVDLMVNCLVQMKVNCSVSKKANRLVDPKARLLGIQRIRKEREKEPVKKRDVKRKGK